MTKKQLLELEFSKKKYDVLPDNKDVAEKVRYLEGVLQQKLDLWGDEQEYNKFKKINSLNLSDRRLMLVYSIMDGSVAKTATFYKVNRKTILTNILRIKTDLGII
jgi:hypothetical protein